MRRWDRGRTERGSGGHVACLAVLSLGLAATTPAAAQTAAGTAVANTAELAWTQDGQARRARSNTDRLIVAERLDLAVEPADGNGFVLANSGTGVEAFALAAASLADPSHAVSLAVDVDEDGFCDPAIDRPLADGRTAPLAPGATLRLVACDVAGPVRVVARAVTGSGEPGTAFDGRGDGGGDAVVGESGAAASLTIGALLADATAAPRFVKSQVALAPDGSARAAVGGTIAYALAARFDAAATVAEIEDPLPAGTRIVPGSLALDGRALSDAADDDAGEVVEGVVRVRLGDVAAGTDHRVTFTVTVTA